MKDIILTIKKAKRVALWYNNVFGEGIVVKITPIANDSMLEITFDSVGTKKVMANFTPITKLN